MSNLGAASARYTKREQERCMVGPAAAAAPSLCQSVEKSPGLFYMNSSESKLLTYQPLRHPHNTKLYEIVAYFKKL